MAVENGPKDGRQSELHRLVHHGDNMDTVTATGVQDTTYSKNRIYFSGV
jgi:hypothetical protein